MTTSPIADAVSRLPVQLEGEVVSLSVHPAPHRYLDVTLTDESGTIVLRFQGRSELAGVHPGTRVRVAGTPLRATGGLLLLNPFYEFVEATTGDALESAKSLRSPARREEDRGATASRQGRPAWRQDLSNRRRS